MRDDSLSLSLLVSCFIHGVVIILASIILKHSISLRRGGGVFFAELMPIPTSIPLMVLETNGPSGRLLCGRNGETDNDDGRNGERQAHG